LIFASASRVEKFDDSQQVPKPPAPEPVVPPGNVPPLPSAGIPVPDPPPPDAPLQPITDPDAIEPGEPNPAHTPMRMRRVKRTPRDPAAKSSALKGREESRYELSNLFSSTALQHAIMEANLTDPSNAAAVTPCASMNDLAPRNWRTDMASNKPVEEASQDFAADLAALRDDVAKLTSSVSEVIRTHTAATTNTVFDAVDSARQKISDTASKTQDRVAGASTDLETTIERNPLAAVLIAMVAGILVGLLSRGRK
jgi:ElaB/YqjD/DUF883 family membrane-anchored ribosome-binding protein